jgi:antitoxin (DNA-binding transcriptional repressor) of toxin-antitoxin stability system
MRFNYVVAIIMATKAVGIRELKLHAPALVGRAARGERIVITRYGRPCAELRSFESSATAPPPAEGTRLAEWQAERQAFRRILSRLEARYRGRHVAIHRGRVVGADTDADRLFERIWRRLGGRTFFIGRVGAPPAIVEMPGFEVEL